MSIKNVLLQVMIERKRQDEIWGKLPRHNGRKWIHILLEEVGEVSTAILNKDRINLREELIHVAAVAIAWIEEIDILEKE